MCHGAARAIRSVARSATPSTALVRAPASLASEGSIMKAVESAGTGAVDKGRVTGEGNMVDWSC
jgi:predicted protein tyrosine phosphatase